LLSPVLRFSHPFACLDIVSTHVDGVMGRFKFTAAAAPSVHVSVCRVEPIPEPSSTLRYIVQDTQLLPFLLRREPAPEFLDGSHIAAVLQSRAAVMLCSL
jgi:hypothetical protein